MTGAGPHARDRPQLPATARPCREIKRIIEIRRARRDPPHRGQSQPSGPDRRPGLAPRPTTRPRPAASSISAPISSTSCAGIGGPMREVYAPACHPTSCPPTWARCWPDSRAGTTGYLANLMTTPAPRAICRSWAPKAGPGPMAGWTPTKVTTCFGGRCEIEESGGGRRERARAPRPRHLRPDPRPTTRTSPPPVVGQGDRISSRPTRWPIRRPSTRPSPHHLHLASRPRCKAPETSRYATSLLIVA